MPGTPALKAGVLAGDEILEIAGKKTAGMNLEQAIKLMKGPIGSSVEIKVRHKHDSSVEDISVQRQTIQIETVLGHHRTDEDKWDFMLDKDQKIGYIRLTSFSRLTAAELKHALTQLREYGMTGLILDLRFNPGGLLSSAVAVADLFLKEGEIVSTKGRNAPKRSWSATNEGTFEGFEMVVLVNRYSASASEIVSACLQDHNRATIIGRRTWGKGSVQNIIELEGGKSALKLTTAGYMRPSGKNIDRAPGATEDDDWGVKPNKGFEVRLTPPQIRNLIMFQRDIDVIASKSNDGTQREFDDPQLKKAIDHLSEGR